MKKYLIWMMASVILTALLSGCGGAGSKKITEDSTVRKTESSQLLEAETASTQTDSEKIAFTGTDIEGNEVSSDVFSESKLTMVNVWATYCNPCLSEMPALGELAEEYDSKEFQIIGIISDVLEGDRQEMIEYAANLIEQTGAGYTHLLLNESVYYALLTEVTGVPTTFFVDENGVILDTVQGAKEKSVWEEKIHVFLEE